MKIQNLQNGFAALMVAGLTLLAANARAQTNATPQLAYGVTEIAQLAQAKVGDDTILAYIRNSGTSYNLDANQIIYLKQQGVSDTVVTTMLNQPKPVAAAAPAPVPVPTTPAPQVTSMASTVSVPTATVAPTVTYVQTVPTTTYYYAQPYYPYYYGGYYPGVSVSLGFGGYYGRGYGGWHGGYYGGGGWHGHR